MIPPPGRAVIISTKPSPSISAAAGELSGKTFALADVQIGSPFFAQMALK
jgi:hypothetical protein